MRILIATDAWEPQVNGVVRTMRTVIEHLRREGHTIEVVHPGCFRTVPCPSYPEIRLAVLPGRKLERVIEAFEPDAVHVVTEGPIGLAARRYLARKGLPFTTAYHTRFPEYIHERSRLPVGIVYRGMRWFHGRAERVLVATDTMMHELHAHGISNAVRWSRGVDLELFHPEKRDDLGLPRPVHTYVGRVAVEKNLEAFLALDTPGTKLVVGDGPQRAALEKRHPEAVFVGAKHGEELARHYASSDVFVFPSRTDTFGLVLLEALASGVPVAAYPVPGPRDVLADALPGTPVGVLDDDLGRACTEALPLERTVCRAYAERFSWEACAALFHSHLAPIAKPHSIAAAG